MKERRIIKGCDYNREEFEKWEKTIIILRYERDFLKDIYIIDYKNKN